MSTDSSNSVIDYEDNNEIYECKKSNSSTSTHSDNYINSPFQKKGKELSTSGKWKCKRCPSKYGKNTSTSTLRQHLKVHDIVALIQKKNKSAVKNHYISYSTKEWQEHDDAITKWILYDLQPFTVIKCKEWRDMIKKFDPCYQFHNHHIEKDHVVTLFENKREQVKLVLSQIPGKASFTSDMWIASNNIIPIEVRHTGSNMANIIMNVLSEFEHATHFLSASNYLTYGDVRFVVFGIHEHLSRYKDNSDFSKAQMAKMMYHKLESYWLILDDSSQILTFLDLRVKLSVFETENEKNKVVDLVSGLSEYISETT
ncbi:24135_t:CDS:2 [Cetraspora pellucida]|uniref:24135_t:CDS:1 n=1 Tax=Cetraspora pellucida TaxID=1433469 RepID=A0A9N8WPW4_9GLOM|nr:24135_t:CDS:2 [Cetraspora pellucida]